jgi:hypothetical protein
MEDRFAGKIVTHGVTRKRIVVWLQYPYELALKQVL